jgi:hypothetical protein
MPAERSADRLDRWRWTGIAAAEMLEQAGFTEVATLTVGSTSLNLLHLIALTARKGLPLLGEPLGGLLERAAAAAPPATGHQRLPFGYVLRGIRLW